MDSTELVKAIRYCVSSEDERSCGDCPHCETITCEVDLMEKAADAIEELQAQIDGWIEQERKALLKSVPKWIPVTELPPEGETYGDTTFSVEVLGTEGFTYRKAYYNFKYKVWLDGNEEWEWPSITHWMPLPEPPKEKTE